MAGSTKAACSETRSCVPPGITVSSAWGSNCARRRPTATGLIGSASPQSNSTGAEMAGKCGASSSRASRNQRGASGFRRANSGRQSSAPSPCTSSPPDVTERTSARTCFGRARAARNARIPAIDCAKSTTGPVIFATTRSTKSESPRTEGSAAAPAKPGQLKKCRCPGCESPSATGFHKAVSPPAPGKNKSASRSSCKASTTFRV